MVNKEPIEFTPKYPNLSITREGQGAEMGVDVDMVQDQRYFESTTLGVVYSLT